MVNVLRENGLQVESNGVGFYTNGLYIETSSVTNIYSKGELVKSFKTPKSAINFLLKN
jgi:hypothetical protein